jgi:hypothetical protein
MSTANLPTDQSGSVSLADVVVRLGQLEQEVQQLKAERKDYSRWLDKIEGSMANDPDFAEILRLGKEIRKSDVS